MRIHFLKARWLAGIVALAILSSLSGGCVVGDGGYGYYDNGYAPYGDYYESDVFFGGGLRDHDRHDHDYRGWGPGYHVAPYRRGGEHFEHGSEHRGGGEHAFRSAPASHPMPSLPSRGAMGSRGGGFGGSRH
jgi:hypothetical protein